MTRYLSEEEPTGKITITHEEAMRELGKIEDDYSEIRQLKKQIAEMHQADLNRLATVRSLSKSIMSRCYSQAKKDGRICSRCGWIITKKNWAKGDRLCYNCEDALKGVNTPPRWGQWLDEPIDKTGEML